MKKSPIRPGPSRPLCLVNKPRTRAQVQMKEPSPVKRIMSRNQEKQTELFPERTNETASLASAKPVKKARLSTLNKLSSRRQSLTAKQSGTLHENFERKKNDSYIPFDQKKTLIDSLDLISVSLYRYKREFI